MIKRKITPLAFKPRLADKRNILGFKALEEPTQSNKNTI